MNGTVEGLTSSARTAQPGESLLLVKLVAALQLVDADGHWCHCVPIPCACSCGAPFTGGCTVVHLGGGLMLP